MPKKNRDFLSKPAHDVSLINALEICGQMSGDPEEDDENWFRPVWETEDEAAPGLRSGQALQPPVPPRPHKPAAEPDYHHPLLTPLARAQDAVARLEARTEAASEAVAEGLRARMAYLEAAGWLRQAHVWIHPWDLALRDNRLTGSYAVAALGNRFATELSSTVAQKAGLNAAPSDGVVNQALRLARLWRRLAELRTWRPLSDAAMLCEALRSLGCRMPEEAEITDWLASVHLLERGPVLIRAARDWMNRPGVEPQNPDGVFPAACLWRETGACPHRSACPSGRRRSRAIIGSRCMSVWRGSPIFSIALRRLPQSVFASSNGCARPRKKAGCSALPRDPACRMRWMPCCAH
jgi:hypothetical protein